MKNEPSLEDLGLNEPAKPSGKISIESLQRQSDFEVATSRPPVISRPAARSVGQDIAAALLTVVLPGVGHGIKGHWGLGLLWFVGVVGSFFLSIWLVLIVQIFCFADAIRIAPKN